jgi:hypothetical protein
VAWLGGGVLGGAAAGSVTTGGGATSRCRGAVGRSSTAARAAAISSPHVA